MRSRRERRASAGRRWAVYLAGAVALAACTAVSPPTPPESTAGSAPTPVSATQSPAIPTATPTANPSAAASLIDWRVDVINGPRPVVIRFNIDDSPPIPSEDWNASGFFWLVKANQRVTLFDEETVAQHGSVDLLQTMDDRPQLGHCYIFETIPFAAGSMTILITGKASGPDYSATIEPGIPPLLPRASAADMTYANCSG
jgi:hypothetical protein